MVLAYVNVVLGEDFGLCKWDIRWWKNFSENPFRKIDEKDFRQFYLAP